MFDIWFPSSMPTLISRLFSKKSKNISHQYNFILKLIETAFNPKIGWSFWLLEPKEFYHYPKRGPMLSQIARYGKGEPGWRKHLSPNIVPRAASWGCGVMEAKHDSYKSWSYKSSFETNIRNWSPAQENRKLFHLIWGPKWLWFQTIRHDRLCWQQSICLSSSCAISSEPWGSKLLKRQCSLPILTHVNYALAIKEGGTSP